VQGATDIAISWDSPCRLPQAAERGRRKLCRLDEAHHAPRPSKPSDWQSMNYLSNTPRFAVSLQKAL